MTGNLYPGEVLLVTRAVPVDKTHYFFILINFIHIKVCYLIEVSATISEGAEAPLKNNLSYHNVEVSEISWVLLVFLCIHSV